MQRNTISEVSASVAERDGDKDMLDYLTQWQDPEMEVTVLVENSRRTAGEHKSIQALHVEVSLYDSYGSILLRPFHLKVCRGFKSVWRGAGKNH